jgi:Sap, sulfolipid-1-addressing protein
MLALLITLAGFALVESLNVLNLTVTSAIVYDSRLHRRSPLSGGLGFLAGLFTATAVVGVAVVLGVDLAAHLRNFEITPGIRYRGELGIGLVLVILACYPAAAQPKSARLVGLRRRPPLLAGAGLVLGFGQAVTDVMYLAALAMLSTHHPRPVFWPAVVLAYCAIALWPPLLVLLLATRRTARAQRMQRRLVRVITRYAPLGVRALCLLAGVALTADSLLHWRYLW